MSHVQSLLSVYNAFTNLFDVEMMVESNILKTVGVDEKIVKNFKFYVTSVTLDEYTLDSEFINTHKVLKIKTYRFPQKLTLQINESSDFEFFKFLRQLYKSYYFDQAANKVKNGYNEKKIKVQVKFFSPLQAHEPNPEPRLEINSSFFLGNVPVPKGDYASASVISYSLTLIAPYGYDVNVYTKEIAIPQDEDTTVSGGRRIGEPNQIL